MEVELKSHTMTPNDMKGKQKALVKERQKELAKKEQSKELQLKLEKLQEEWKKEAKQVSNLSLEEEERKEEVAMYEEKLEREELTTKKRKLEKNPNVDTRFMPDRDREEVENWHKEELHQDWEAKQEKIESEEIAPTYS